MKSVYFFEDFNITKTTSDINVKTCFLGFYFETLV